MRFALFSLIPLLALTACGQFMDLEPMPAGYSYYQEPYKSQPAKYAPGIGYPWSPERNQVVIEKWEVVAATLVDRLQSQLNFMPQPVYVEMLPADNAFNYAFDYVLRQELRRRGYYLTNAPGGNSVHLRPEAYLPEDRSKYTTIKDLKSEPPPLEKPAHPEKAERFIISLTVLRDDDVLGKVEDTFLLPAYGYAHREGRQSWWKRGMDQDDDNPPAKGQEFPVDSWGVSDEPQQLIPTPVESEVIEAPQ